MQEVSNGVGVEELLTTPELAKLLKMSESTIRKWTHYDYIPHVKVGRSVRFGPKTIQEWVQNHTHAGKAKIIPEFHLN